MIGAATPEALSMVGKAMTWEQIAPKQRTVTGMCVGARRAPGLMRTEHGDFPCVQFCIQLDDGKVVWTTSFADNPKEITVNA